MSDLPQRLRCWSEKGGAEAAIMIEAADEIDRLKGLLHDHALPSHWDESTIHVVRPQVLHLTVSLTSSRLGRLAIPFDSVDQVVYLQDHEGCTVNDVVVRETYDEVLALLGWTKKE